VCNSSRCGVVCKTKSSLGFSRNKCEQVNRIVVAEICKPLHTWRNYPREKFASCHDRAVEARRLEK
jgi:hypothetical protein